MEQFKKNLIDICKVKEMYPCIKVDDIKIRQTYHNRINSKHIVHNGQRKLFLSELEFLTLYCRKIKYILYAGAAPSMKTYYLSLLFPDKVFILIDPNKFDILIYPNKNQHKFILETIKYLDPKKSNTWLKTIKSSDKVRIFLINDYYTDTISDIFKDETTAFISDIRTNDY
jgi:hypothetical protein